MLFDQLRFYNSHDQRKQEGTQKENDRKLQSEQVEACTETVKDNQKDCASSTSSACILQNWFFFQRKLSPTGEKTTRFRMLDQKPVTDEPTG